MQVIYPIELKKMVCIEVVENNRKQPKVADEYDVPFKTVEKWVAEYRLNPDVFDNKESKKMSRQQLRVKYQSCPRDRLINKIVNLELQNEQLSKLNEKLLEKQKKENNIQ